MVVEFIPFSFPTTAIIERLAFVRGRVVPPLSNAGIAPTHVRLTTGAFAPGVRLAGSCTEFLFLKIVSIASTAAIIEVLTFVRS